MSPVNPAPVFLSLVVALGLLFLLLRHMDAPKQENRCMAIDGLRGYLAFFVFLHHGCIWYFYRGSGTWEVPPSNLFTHLGESSVAMFFMITGFLFYSKLLSGRKSGIDWFLLFVSRVLRLAPLYLLSMAALFTIVWVSTGASIHEPVGSLLKHAAYWLSFTVYATPDVNGLKNTWMIMAGVTWSLRYEWTFYFFLPVLATTVGVLPPARYLILTMLCLFISPNFGQLRWLPFLSGIVAAVLLRNAVMRRVASTRSASLLALACLVVAIVFYPTAYAPGALLLLSVAFLVIAGGNTMFGMLDNALSRAFGELAYAIYLTHGIVLYIVFNFMIGGRMLSPFLHWCVVVAATPVLILIAVAAHRLVEAPAMHSTKRVARWLQSRRNWSVAMAAAVRRRGKGV